MPRWFDLPEFLSSPAGKAAGIDNTPSFEVVEHLRELTEMVLDPLRSAWGGPVIVTSGYRCPELNALVGGVRNSAHITGYAADILPGDGRIAAFMDFVPKFIRGAGIRFDQLIDERVGGKRWAHIAVRDTLGRQRGQIFQL